MEDKVQDNYSLYKSLQIMADHDEEVGNVTFEMFQKAANGQKPKVDEGFKYTLNLESRIDAIDKEIKLLQEAKKSIKSTIENHKKFTDFTMKKFGLSKLQGDHYTLYRQERKKLDFKNIELNQDIFLDLNLKRPNTVKQEFKLDKTNFKQLCDKYPEIKEKYADESVTSFVSYRTRKGV
jgi:hypothetical protein